MKTPLKRISRGEPGRPVRRFLFLICLFMGAFLLSGQARGGSAVPGGSSATGGSSAAGRQTPQELYRQGEEARITGRHYQAIEFYMAALEENPSFLGPLQGLAESYFALGEYQEARTHGEAARRLDGRDYGTLNLLGRISLGLGLFDDAADYFSRVLAGQPNNVDAQFGMAELEIAQGRIQNAAARYQSALRISPENRRALLSLVLLYDQLGNPDAAEEYIQQALHFYGDNSQVRYIAGKHYHLRGRTSLALEHTRAALRLNPDYLEAALFQGQLQMETGSPGGAVEILRPFLTGHRDDPMLWYSLGRAYQGGGQVEEAIHAFATSSSLRSGDDMARIGLENLLIHQLPLNDPRRERYGAYHFTLGREYDQRNLSRRAYQEFRRGLQIAPYSREGRLLLADMFRRSGSLGRYYQELQLLVKDGLDNIDIRDEIEFLETRLEDSVSSRWGIDQFSLARPATRLGVFYRKSSLYHHSGEGDLITYLKDMLSGYQRLELLDVPAKVDSFSQAFRLARENQSQYFIILDFDEGERYISVKASVYLSETGTELKTWQVHRTGNQRVPEALAKVSDDINRLVPVYGRIAERRFDRGILDLGITDGIAGEDVFLIVRNGELALSKTGFGYEYGPDAVLGDFTVTITDDLVSEGRIRNRGYFDMVNQGDFLIPVSPEDLDQIISDAPQGLDLYRDLLKIN